MTDDSIGKLLLRADAAAPPPALGGDFAGRVRRTARRRAQVRAGSAALAVSAGCVVLVATLMRPAPVSPAAGLTASQVAQIEAELASLDSMAAMCRHTAEELQRREALASVARKTGELLALPSPMQRIAEARDRTALIILRQADRSAAGSGDTILANEMYRRVVRLFPETPTGRVAAERLKLQNAPT